MLDVHYPYPGVALVVTDQGSVLLGAPADAFKATKAFCKEHQLPFPRVLVAPQRLVAHANPQFAPEFFLYDFLFVYGAAFKKEYSAERLQLVLDSTHTDGARRALYLTLYGPSHSELLSYIDPQGRPLVEPAQATMLARISEHLAIKKNGKPIPLEDMVEVRTFDRSGAVELLGGTLQLTRTGAASFLAKKGDSMEHVELDFPPPVKPFVVPPLPQTIEVPLRLGVKPLGTRSGFDLSGPTTGFLLWVNGRVVIYDGPVGTPYILERQGISPNDVAAVILSHCHEDHMCGFLELVLSGIKPRVITAEPVYRSMLTKLAFHLSLTEEQAAALIDYQRIIPGKPVLEFGAEFDFFYTAHPLPTLGMNVSMEGPDRTVYRICISGDTIHHDGLAQMHAQGVVDDETYARLKHFVPNERDPNAIYFADVGEASIHGSPKDWQGNPNRVFYYHCPDDERLRSFGHPLAQAGETHALLEAPSVHPAVPGKLLRALAAISTNGSKWLSHLLFRGRMRQAVAGELLADVGSRAPFSLVINGTASALGPSGDVLQYLRPGEFFGVIEFTVRDGRLRSAIRAETPLEIFELSESTLADFFRLSGAAAKVERLRTNRPILDSSALFRSLHIPERNTLAVAATIATFKKDDFILQQGEPGDDLFVLAEGIAIFEPAGLSGIPLAAGDDDAFFGEIAALHPERPRTTTVRAKTQVVTLRIPGAEIRHLCETQMGVRAQLTRALELRGGIAPPSMILPVAPRD